jgi:hypothetical protein
MAWSYDESDLGTTTVSNRLNSVRLLLGDTDTTDQQVQNEEIVFALGQTSNNIYLSAAWAARVVAAKYSRQVTTNLSGALSADYSDLASQYSSLADSLEYQGKKAGAVLGIKAGGITKSGVDAVRLDTNRIKPSFRRDKFHNPPSYSGNEYEN